MKKRVLALVVLAVLMVCPSAWPSEYADGEVLAVFRVPEGVRASEAKIRVAGAEISETYEALSEAEGKSFVLIRSAVKTTEELISELKQNPDVIAVSPNYRVRRLPQSITPSKGLMPSETLTSSENASIFPNDPSADLCWGLKAIRAPEVWPYTTGSREIHVCIIDSGIYRHPDLDANIAGTLGLNTQTVSGEYDLTFGSWDADFAGHGTHVAGTIGAVGNNGLGVSGVNWNVSIIPVRVFDVEDAYETINFEIRGLNYIVSLLQKNPDMKLAALNFSLGAYLPNTPEEMKNDVYYMAYQALDNTNRTLIVVAAGNKSVSVDRPTPFEGNDFKAGYYCYPAGFAGLKNLVVVGAMASDGTAAVFTNWGDSVDIAAPGVEILSTYSPMAISSRRPDMYMYMNGTSMAVPHVTGAAALLMSAYPDATPAQIKAALLDGANRDKNPVVYPYTYAVEDDMKDAIELVDLSIEFGRYPAESRDALIEEERAKTQERYAKYKPLDGAGRVSRTGLLDVKAAYDLLGERVKPLASSSGGCNAGYTVVMVLAVMLWLALIPEKH